MDNYIEDTNHITFNKERIVKGILNSFEKEQKKFNLEEDKEDEITDEVTVEQKNQIKQYIKTHPHLDDADFHKFAISLGINEHEAEEAVYEMFNEIFNKENNLEGGEADNFTSEQIAAKHKMTIQELQTQINLGLKIEKEHTKNEKEALEITLDHLIEDGKYYTKAKPKNWAEKELEEEKEIEKAIDELLLTKALPPREGEIREYKDGAYRFTNGHWKKIKEGEIKETKSEVLKMYKKGSSQAEISDKLGLDISTVANYTKHLGHIVGKNEEEDRIGDDPQSKQYEGRTISDNKKPKKEEEIDSFIKNLPKDFDEKFKDKFNQLTDPELGEEAFRTDLAYQLAFEQLLKKEDVNFIMSLLDESQTPDSLRLYFSKKMESKFPDSNLDW